MRKLKKLISRLISTFGPAIRDERTGRILGRALPLAWGGRLWLVGLHRPYVRAVFLPRANVRYARSRLGFATHPPVDFPRLGRGIANSSLPIAHSQSAGLSPAELINSRPRGAGGDRQPQVARRVEQREINQKSTAELGETDNRRLPEGFRLAKSINNPATPSILFAILLHQTPDACGRVLQHWRGLGYGADDLLVVFGGSQADFEGVSHPHKVFVPDQNLRTASHPVEKQSYAGPLREISSWLSGKSHTHVCLVEYDHLPLVADWGERLLQRLADENADVLFHHLERVDGTNAPHYLHHLSDPRFAGSWQALSQREDSGVVLDALTTGSFWTREAFEAVAARREPVPIYQEMDLPTTAHHLGFRVRDHGPQNTFIHFDTHPEAIVRTATGKGAWSIHPVKEGMGKF